MRVFMHETIQAHMVAHVIRVARTAHAPFEIIYSYCYILHPDEMKNSMGRGTNTVFCKVLSFVSTEMAWSP